MYLVNSEKNNYLSFSINELWGFKVVASIEATQARTGSKGVSSAHGLSFIFNNEKKNSEK